MADKKTVFTRLGRAGVGLAVTAGSFGAIIVLSTFAMPTIELQPQAAAVDASSNASRTIACNGSMLELGADPAQPLLAVATGTSAVTAHSATGDEAQQSSFAREGEGAGAGSGVLYELNGDQVYAQAFSESESPATGSLRGYVATQCVEASSESWIVAGTTTTGSVSILSLTNPGDVPATVFVKVFDDQGEVESLQSAGVVVQPKSQKNVSLNGYAPDRKMLAVQVVSRGAKVVATLQESLVLGLAPSGVDTVQGISSPAKNLVIAGIETPASAAADEHGNSDAGHTLRIVAPGAKGGTFTAYGVNAEGKRENLVTEYLHPAQVAEFSLETLTAEFTSVVIEAEVPVVASITGIAKGGAGEDIAWFAPDPALTREVPFAVPAGPNPMLTIYNPNDADVTVDLVAGQGNTEDANLKIAVPAKSSVRQPVVAGSGYQLLAGGKIYAAISFAGDGAMSGFPLTPPADSADQVLVYTR